MKRRLYLAAVNNRYGQNVFLPYAAGLLWCYARRRSDVSSSYELCGTLFLKEPTERAADRLQQPEVVAFSSYIWNHEWNRALAREVKRRWPACVTVVGGIQVEAESPRALEEEPAFDFAIYGEGEGAFAEFLVAHLRGAYETVGSLVWRDGATIRVNPRRAEVPIDDIPSPYLDGFFDELLSDRRWSFQALQETNRGCPYACSFCAWGESSLSKLRQFPAHRVVEEFDWMAQHQIEFLYNCDANWGILKRDLDLTRSLVDVKERFGYPKTFRAAFAKNSNDTVFDISRRLNAAGMLKATTLALQSMDDDVLQLIRRKNIKYERLSQLSRKYEEAGIATYTELILGLPGESLDQFREGIDAVLESGQHTGLSIYLCMLLPNTEMATPAYRAQHGIRSAAMKALLYHGTPEPGVVEEIQETVIATKAMPEADLRFAFLYGCLVQALHGFGLTQHLARSLRKEHGIPYREFYNGLARWLRGRPSTVLGRASARVLRAWDGAVEGRSWDTIDPRFGTIMWPPEELLFLLVACEADAFYEELLLDFIHPAAEPALTEQRRRFIPPVPGHEEEYAREAVWFGRKGRGESLRLLPPQEASQQAPKAVE